MFEHRQRRPKGLGMIRSELDPVRAEALRAAVNICTPGNYPGVGRRLESTLICADAFVCFLRGAGPTTEAAPDAIAAEKAA